MEKTQLKSLALKEFCKRQPIYWVENFLSSIDEHSAITPIRKFPKREYIRIIIKEFFANSRLFVAKSRQIFATWTFSALALYSAQFFSHQKVFIISKKQEDAFELIKRIRHLYMSQPTWLRALCPLARKLVDQPQGYLYFANGSEIRGLPQGPDQIRSYTASLIMVDEAAFLDLLEDTYGACVPAIAGGGKLVVFSSAGLSYFGSLVEIKDEKDFGTPVIEGVWKKLNSSGIPVLTIMFTADPDKNTLTEKGRDWFNEMIKDYPGGINSNKFRKEMLIDFTVGNGEPVFDYMADIESEIKFSFDEVVTPKFIEECEFYAGMDWGTKNNAAFDVIAEDRKGDFWLVWELAIPGPTPNAWAEEVRKCPFYEKLVWIAADLNMWTNNQSRKEGYTNFARILQEEVEESNRLTKLMPTHGRNDLMAVNRIHSYWKTFKRFRIANTCTNTLRELKNLRYVPTVGDKSSSEKLVDKDNHNWDCIKYILLSHPSAKVMTEKLTFGTLGYINKVAEMAREQASETGQPLEEVFNDFYGTQV